MSSNARKGGHLLPADFHAGPPPTCRQCRPAPGCEKRIRIFPTHTGDGRRFRGVGMIDCTMDGLVLRSGQPMRDGKQFFAKLKLKGLVLMLYEVQKCDPCSCGQYRIEARWVAYCGAPGQIDPRRLIQALSANPAA